MRKSSNVKQVAEVTADLERQRQSQHPATVVAEDDPDSQISAKLDMLLDRNGEREHRLAYSLTVSRKGSVCLDDYRPIRSQHAHFERFQRRPVDAEIPEAQEARIPHVEPGRAFPVAVARPLANEVQLILLEHEFVIQHLVAALSPSAVFGASRPWRSARSRSLDCSQRAWRGSLETASSAGRALTRRGHRLGRADRSSHIHLPLPTV